jgi:hypothetical protein
MLMLRSALGGFDGAWQRFTAASAPGMPPELVYVPLTEALWWAVSLDCGFEDLAGQGLGWPNLGAYRDARRNDKSGRVLVGLRFARDRCGHQLALAVLEDGLRAPLRFPITTGCLFRWRPSDQLPLPAAQNLRDQAERIRPEYDTWLAGRPAAITVESAAKWFAHAANTAGI